MPDKYSLSSTILYLIFALWLSGSFSSWAAAQSNQKPANISAEDWKYSGRNGIVAYRLDGKILNMMHVDGRRFLRQGYDAKRDDKRNVEASPSDQYPTLPSRGLGYEWVLEYTGDGYYRIINLTTGLNLTWDGNDNNVSNWGAMPSNVDHQKWKFVLSDRQQPIISDLAVSGTYGTFRIYNKASGKPLTMYDFGKNSDEENVTIWPDPGPRAPGFDWVLMPGRDLPAEANVRANNMQKGGVLKSYYSDSLISVRRVTIENVKAIKVSTGQDDATKALFTGIDVLVDAGMGVATGGASAAASTAVRVGGRALTKEVITSAAKAGAKKAIKGVTKKSLVQDYAKGLAENKAQDYAKKQIAQRQEITEKDVGEDVALEMAELGLDILDAMSSEAIFNEVYGESPDDFYIRVNGFSIFPHGGREHLDIESQQTLTVNKSFVFDRFNGATIQLVEYDSASDDDGLGSTSWFPYWDSEEGVWYEFGEISALKGGKGYMTAAEREALPTISLAGKNPIDGVERYEGVLISEEDEGSLYEITYRIEPFVPAFRSTGNMDAAKVKKRMQDWESQTVKPLSNDKRAHMMSKLYGNCGTRGATRSISSGGKARQIRMYNRGNRPISIYKVNDKGHEGNHASRDKPIHTIAPGKNVLELGSPQYVYIAVDSNGECVGLGMPSWPYVEYEFNFNPDLVVPGKHPKKIDHAAIAAEAAAKARAAEEKAAQGRADAANAAEASRWTAHSKKLYDTCARRGSVKSVESSGDVAASINMSNSGSKSVSVYWINTQGEEVNYASQDAPIQTIESGPYAAEEFGAPGYWYIAVDDSGECVGMGNAAESNNVFMFNPDLVVPGTYPGKAAAPAQTGYANDGPGYVDTNEYADDQSSLEDYVDTNEYAEDQSGLGDYEEDMSQYIDPSGGANISDYTPEATMSEGPGCEFLGQVSSPDGGAIVTIQFSNLTNGQIEVFWINAQGEAGDYQGMGGSVASIPAQSFQGVRSKIGHVFAAADVNGNCLGVGQVETDGDDFKFMPLN